LWKGVKRVNRKSMWLIGLILFIGVVYAAMQIGDLHTGAQFGVWAGILGVAFIVTHSKRH